MGVRVCNGRASRQWACDVTVWEGEKEGEKEGAEKGAEKEGVEKEGAEKEGALRRRVP